MGASLSHQVAGPLGIFLGRGDDGRGSFKRGGGDERTSGAAACTTIPHGAAAFMTFFHMEASLYKKLRISFLGMPVS
jgi:hypothetical protein